MKQPGWRRPMGILLCGSAVLAGTVAVSMAVASPTSDEFRRCDGMAQGTLKACLDEHSGQRNDACWQDARQRHVACYRMVHNQYVRPDPQSEAVRRAAEMQAQADARARADAAAKAPSSSPAPR